MMSSSVCVDASLVLQLLVPAALSDEASRVYEDWRRRDLELIAPALMAFEVVSTLRRLVYLGELTAGEGEAALSAFLRMNVRLSHRRGLFPLAWQLATKFRQSRAYDSAYLALAQLTSAEFWTADERLANAVGDELPWVRWLGAEVDPEPKAL